jgi:2',3'-cyclic-nucleotide 2'-phosphodiesterase (5'-nucleotidase family)
MKFISVCILSLILLSCGTKKVVDYSANNTEVTADVMEATMNEVAGEASVTLERGEIESPLGNFAADAMYAAALVYAQKTKDIGINAMSKSICLLNFGGLRSIINKGDITVGNVYEFMPFDNTLTLVKISGAKARELAVYLFEMRGQPVSNATFQLSSDKQIMTIGGEPYNFDEDIIVVTSDYLANGGDKMNFFADPIRKWDSGYLMRDLYMDFIESEGTLGDYAVEDRITIVR